MLRWHCQLCLSLLLVVPSAVHAQVRVRGWVTGMRPGETAFVKLEGPAVYRALTKPSGQWEVPAAAPGDYRVTVDSEKYSFTPPSRTITLRTGTVQAINFKARARANTEETAEKKLFTIKGRILGLPGGKRATIRALGPETLETTSKPGGRFSLGGDLHGKYRVEASLDGYTFKPGYRKVNTRRRKKRVLRFRAQKKVVDHGPESWMSGTVSGLKPGEFAIIRGRGRRRFTHRVDENGPYEINNIKKGRYRVFIRVPHCHGCAYAPGMLKVDIIQRGKTKIDFHIIHM